MQKPEQPEESAFTPGSVVPAFLHHNEITGSFLTSLHKLAVHEDRLLFPPIQNQCNSDLAAGRNQLAAAFLNQTGGEWLLLIDDDMGFAPDIVHRLLSSADPKSRPVVGGLCFAYKRYEHTSDHAERFVVRPTIYRFVETETTIGFSAVTAGDYERDSVVQVDATGAAMLLIHRSILEGMQAAAGPNWFSLVTVPKGPGGQTTFSEDLSFCYKLRSAGIPMHVNTAAKTSHRKPIYLDEWYADNQPVRTVEPEVAIVGTGRSGTGFIAACMSACNVTVGHEQWWNVFGVRAPGLTGDASWQAAPYLDDFGGRVWHQVRHPLDVISSMLGGPQFDADAPDWVAPFEAELRRHAGYALDDDPIVKAMRVVAHWWGLCEKHAERTWRLEDVTPGLLVELCDQLGADVPLRFARAVIDAHGTTTNKHADGPALTWADLPDGDDKTEIMRLSAEFGYEVI